MAIYDDLWLLIQLSEEDTKDYKTNSYDHEMNSWSKNPLLKQTIYIVVPKYKPTYIDKNLQYLEWSLQFSCFHDYYKNVRFSSGI